MYRIIVETDNVRNLTDVLRAIADFEEKPGIRIDIITEQMLLLPPPSVYAEPTPPPRETEIAEAARPVEKYATPLIRTPTKWKFANFSGRKRSEKDIDEDIWEHLPDAVISVPDLIFQMRKAHPVQANFFSEKTMLRSINRLARGHRLEIVRQEGVTLFVRRHG